MNPSANVSRRVPAAILAFLVIGSLTACGTAPVRSGPDTRPLAERAAERATLFAQGEFSKAWEYTTPGHQAAVPQDLYVEQSRTKPVQWTAATFVAADCGEEAMRCEVELDVKYRTLIPMRWGGRMELESRVKEDWIRLDGVWYLVPAGFR